MLRACIYLLGGAMKARTQGNPPTVEVADLWHFYDEHATQARQHETLRATVTGTLAAIAAAVVTLSGIGGLSMADIPAGAVLIVVGALGVALNVKHFERNRWHAEVMWTVQQEIERIRLWPERRARPMSELWEAAKVSHADKFTTRKRRRRNSRSRGGHSEREMEYSDIREPRWVRMRLFALWVGLSVGIILVGLLVITLSIIGVSLN